MTDAERQRCDEIERQLKETPTLDSYAHHRSFFKDIRFLIDLARRLKADRDEVAGILSDLLEGQGTARLDALLAAAEKRAAVQIVGLCSGPWSANSGGWIADFLKIRYSLPTLEEPGR